MSNYSNGSYDVFYDYAYRFYADEAVATTVDRMFKEHIDTILTRRNTVNGKFYKEDPVVMGMTWINLCGQIIKLLMVSLYLASLGDC